MPDAEFITALEPPYSITYSGSWRAGTTLTFSWTGVTVDAPCGPVFYAVNGNVPSLLNDPLPQSTYTNVQLSGSVSHVLAHDQTSYGFNAYTSSYCSTGRLHGVSLSVTPP